MPGAPGGGAAGASPRDAAEGGVGALLGRITGATGGGLLAEGGGGGGGT